MKFSTRHRVEVHGLRGMLYRVHVEEAHRMIAAEQAEFVDARSIRICGGLGSIPRAARDDGRSSESSLVTTRRERMQAGGVLIQHKPIHADDAGLYRLAVTDCLR